MPSVESIRQAIIADPMNQTYSAQGFEPLFAAHPKARMVIVGQAPGLKTQQANQVWQDASGERLRAWLGVDSATFYDPEIFGQLPMDFYYPGKAAQGDLPPRKGFAEKWHPALLALMPQVELMILAGVSAQRYYLAAKAKANLTETVRHYHEYLPEFFPIVHPSPLNFRWHGKNPWFEAEVVPQLRQIVAGIIKRP